MTDNDRTTIATVALGGHDGPRVGVQGLGCMGMSEFYGDTDERSARDTLDAALEAGVTLFDTADVYGRGPMRNSSHRSSGPTGTRSPSPPSSRWCAPTTPGTGA